MASRALENSTNVRFKKALAPLRLGVGLGEVVSSDLAGRLALRAFLTPRRSPRPAEEQALLTRAEPLHLPALAGTPVAAWSWGRGPAVLLVHGWAGRGAQLGALVEPLVAGGCRVIAFDAPAHGDSPGTQTALVDVARVVAAIDAAIQADTGAGLRGIVAHSFGAAAVTLALARGVTAQQVVFLAPVASLETTVEAFTAAAGLSAAARGAFRRHLAERNGAGPELLEPVALAPLMTAPLLIVHDVGDRETPLTGAVALADAWRSARLVPTHELGHHRLLRDPYVVSLASAFVLGHELPPAPPSLGDLVELDLRDREARLAHAFA